MQVSSTCANVVNSSSSWQCFVLFKHFTLLFADLTDFFLISAMLKLHIKPCSVASPISLRRENQSFDRLKWICCTSATCSSRQAIIIIVLEKSSFQLTDKYQTICWSKNLFVLFLHQIICSSETICLSRQFICPLVWKRPIMIPFLCVHNYFACVGAKEILKSMQSRVDLQSHWAWQLEKSLQTKLWHPV